MNGRAIEALFENYYMPQEVIDDPDVRAAAERIRGAVSTIPPGHPLERLKDRMLEPLRRYGLMERK
ncbi:MAG: hypothetical protein ABIJ46_02820 [bacterium]